MIRINYHSFIPRSDVTNFKLILIKLETKQMKTEISYSIKRNDEILLTDDRRLLILGPSNS